ncbi:putative protein IQ-DOMAIN 14-like [Cocos nucifera]|uniref:DUF4005 domain-containing protein n=1 Tax=Cocos nucifera TaxID=13894 RepID=A0A8K0IV01_COCNU|nr:putative protein IQ-DOMAIN 14-like [Cocos nucifera]
MGRATRWLRSLLCRKKDAKDQKDNAGNSVGERKEKRRWSFGKPGKGSSEGEAQNTVPAAEPAWMRSFYAESKEQNMHAIAMAVATTAAASAAVTAAQAAVERLQSQRKGTMFNGVIERWAAIKIQTAFRGYLAKKALRALKALVKIQALVRGYLVRKQAAATLHGLQAVIRAQAAARKQNSCSLPTKYGRFQPEIPPRRSYERFDERRSEQIATVHSRRLATCLDGPTYGFNKSPKIVEMDAWRTKSRSSHRINHSVSKPTEDHHSLPISSLYPYQIPPRLSIPIRRFSEDQDSSLGGHDKSRYSKTAYNTPRCMSHASNTPATPAQSLDAVDGVLRRILSTRNQPNYMANTRSSTAKVRSQSAPKQRPEMAGLRKKVSSNLDEVESRASLIGFGSRKSCSQVQGAYKFKSTVVERLDRHHSKTKTKTFRKSRKVSVMPTMMTLKRRRWKERLEENESINGIELVTERDRGALVEDGTLNAEAISEEVGSSNEVEQEAYIEENTKARTDSGSQKVEIWGAESVQVHSIAQFSDESSQVSETELLAIDSSVGQDAQIDRCSSFETEKDFAEEAQVMGNLEVVESLQVPLPKIVSSALSKNQKPEESKISSDSVKELKWDRISLFASKYVFQLLYIFIFLSTIIVFSGMHKYFTEFHKNSTPTSHIPPPLKPASELALEKKNSLLVSVKEEEENKGGDADAFQRPLAHLNDEPKKFMGVQPPTVELLAEFSVVAAAVSGTHSSQKVRSGLADSAEESQLSQSQSKMSVKRNISSSANEVHPSPSKSSSAPESISTGNSTAQKLQRKKVSHGYT